VVGEGQEVRPGMRRKWSPVSSAGGQRKIGGGRWSRDQARDEEEVVCLKAAGVAEDWVVGVGRDVRPWTRRNWLPRQEDEGLRLALVLLPIVTMNATRGDTRADRKEKEEKRVVFLRAGELSTYIPARTLLNHPNHESYHRSMTLRQTTL